jgi:hypothetical protein
MGIWEDFEILCYSIELSINYALFKIFRLVISITKSEIIESIKEIFFSKTFNGAKEDVEHDGRHLFNLGDFAGFSLGTNFVFNEDIRQILTRSGTLAPTIEFRPSQPFKSRVKTKERLPLTIKIEGLQDWFSKLLLDNSETFYLVPDTNF